MRFDDTIATVLRQPADREDRVAAKWRQLVDLLAQRRGGADETVVRQALEFLRSHRWEVSQSRRREAAIALTGLSVSPELVAFFAEDNAAVAAPLMASAQLNRDEWLALLPRLGPTARALLRHRRDLPQEVQDALETFGSSDFVLESPVEEPAAQTPEIAAEQEEADEEILELGDFPVEPAGQPEVEIAETQPVEFVEALPSEPVEAILAEPVPTVEPEPVASTSAPAGREPDSQIQELVERIETYRRRRDLQPSIVPRSVDEGFRWETGTDGTVRWVEGASREALVGLSLATIAGPGQFGVDGQAAGAFEKKDPFRDARFSVAGEGRASGDWRISGVPFFDPHRGAFLGYRGTARRPRLDETASGADGTVFGPNFPADSLRQLIHELRTPLNAIIGFSEMIEGQYLGPAARGYRGRASDIREQARRLLTAVDDLDTAARIETRRLDLDESNVDAAALIARLAHSYDRVATQRGSRLTLDIAHNLPMAQVEAAATERMFARLLAATIGVAGPGETIATAFFVERGTGRPMLCLTIGRPQAIAGLSESDLLDPGYSPEGDWPDAPVLGLGFALRLVRNLAEAAGGTLLIGPEEISLYLPAEVDAPPAAGQSETGA